MIIIKDTYSNGLTSIQELKTWEEAEELFEAASHSQKVIACTIRDLKTGRYRTANFSAIRRENRLQSQSIKRTPIPPSTDLEGIS